MHFKLCLGQAPQICLLPVAQLQSACILEPELCACALVMCMSGVMHKLKWVLCYGMLCCAAVLVQIMWEELDRIEATTAAERAARAKLNGSIKQ